MKYNKKIKKSKRTTLSVIEEVDEMMISKIESIIDKHLLDSTFSVSEIEKQIGVSRPVLLSQFKRVKGTTLVNYIKLERLKKASLLLINTNKNISEVAYQVGFSDPKYFSRAFRIEYGETPTEYRKIKRNS
ncbi:AraC family transcriptional regulator [Flammeovirga sp. SubArs3]|uniref:helix-turn-helix domain-containing protein n=1 Tax=Flammeovirga sp. SubArs3 TaxID=2995316 RepID=UPI00248B1DD5|nr:AraC family transcriptional regulator [Flammeovirga sp. SubArs3]